MGNKKGKIESVHPLFSTIKYKEINATPLKNVPLNPNSELITVEHLSHIVDQNNFTNLYLQTIGSQTQRIKYLISQQESSSSAQFKVTREVPALCSDFISKLTLDQKTFKIPCWF